MTKFVPVVIAEPTDETSRSSFAATLSLIDRPELYREPVIVVPGGLLSSAMFAAGERAGQATFVTVPDGSGHAIMAAAGCVIADIDCPDSPILLMDADIDRREFSDYHREVIRCARQVDDGAIAMFTSGEDVGTEMPTGDYALSYATLREEYMSHAPGILSYATAAAQRAVTDRNIVRLDEEPLYFRDPGSFYDVIASVSKATTPIRHRIGALRSYSPWTRQKDSYDGFYRASFAPGA